jgi:hypothetical protein
MVGEELINKLSHRGGPAVGPTPIFTAENAEPAEEPISVLIFVSFLRDLCVLGGE